MPEGIGGLVFQGAEHLAESGALGAKTSELTRSFVDHTFTLDSKLTGKGGAMISKMKKAFEDRMTYHLGIDTEAAKAMPQHLQPEPNLIKAQAVQKARDAVFGPKHQNLAVALRQMQQEHGAFGNEKVAAVSDHLAAYFHDKAYDMSGNANAFGKTSKLSADLSKYKVFKDVDFKLSGYKSPKGGERVLKTVGTGAFAYKAAVAHGVQGFVNSFMNARASSQVKSVVQLFGDGYANTKANVIASHAWGDESFREYQQMWNYRGSAISKYVPDSIGEFIHKNWMIPGITAARNINMIHSALVGKYEAQYAAHALVNGMEKRGSQALDLLGLNWRDIQARGGVLTKPEEQQAMRAMINNNMFRDREGAKTKLAINSPVVRLGTIFHSYANMQSRLLFESTKRNMLQFHDPAMFFQQLAALAVIVPTVGNAIYSIDQAWMGKNEHPIDNFVGREKAIYSGHGSAEILESIAHMGGFGFAYGTIQAANKQRLANYVLGAPISSVLETAQDATKGIHNTDDHPHQADQFYRDMLHDIPSLGATGWIANKYLPTKAQRDSDRPMTPRRIKAAMRRKRKPSN